jgi:hypothetical protein
LAGSCNLFSRLLDRRRVPLTSSTCLEVIMLALANFSVSRSDDMLFLIRSWFARFFEEVEVEESVSLRSTIVVRNAAVRKTV